MKSTAIVTGANKGIGFEIARGLLKESDNLHVIIGCRDYNRGLKALNALKAEFPNKASSVSLESIDIGDENSISEFTKTISERYKNVDIIVHNAAMAFKNSDPTPFYKQAAPTLQVNYFGTFLLNEKLFPLLSNSTNPRVVFVASQSGSSAYGNCSNEVKNQLKKCSIEDVDKMATNFVQICEKSKDDASSNLKKNGFATTCYGMSKLFVIAHVKKLAKKNPNVFYASFCPGYCKTDMTSQQGVRSPEKGAETGIFLALQDVDPKKSGSFWYDGQDISFL